LEDVRLTDDKIVRKQGAINLGRSTEITSKRLAERKLAESQKNKPSKTMVSGHIGIPEWPKPGWSLLGTLLYLTGLASLAVVGNREAILKRVARSLCRTLTFLKV
jgi:hypothetical protein